MSANAAAIADTPESVVDGFAWAETTGESRNGRSLTGPSPIATAIRRPSITTRRSASRRFLIGSTSPLRLTRRHPPGQLRYADGLAAPRLGSAADEGRPLTAIV